MNQAPAPPLDNQFRDLRQPIGAGGGPGSGPIGGDPQYNNNNRYMGPSGGPGGQYNSGGADGQDG